MNLIFVQNSFFVFSYTRMTLVPKTTEECDILLKQMWRENPDIGNIIADDDSFLCT